MLITAQESTVVHVKPALYPTLVVRSYIDKMANPQYGDGTVLRLDCCLDNVLDEKGGAIILDTIANPVLTPRSKLWGWCEIMDMKPYIGMQLDTDAFEGKRPWVQVIDKMSKDGTGTIYSVISDLVYGPVNGSLPVAPPQPTLLNPDGSVNFNVYWTEATNRGITQAMIKAQLETADLDELGRMPPLDVLELLSILRPQT